MSRWICIESSPTPLGAHQKGLDPSVCTLTIRTDHDINVISARAEEDGKDNYLNDEFVYSD